MEDNKRSLTENVSEFLGSKLGKFISHLGVGVAAVAGTVFLMKNVEPEEDDFWESTELPADTDETVDVDDELVETTEEEEA